MTLGEHHWFEPVAEQLGAAYLRYSFNRGTAREIAVLAELLDPLRGARLLDVGCGPGRHAVALAAAGARVTGVDISRRFLEVAAHEARAAPGSPTVPRGASFVRADAARLPFGASFDAAISVCQGAFGMAGRPDPRGGDLPPGGIDPDGEILEEVARVLRPGGRLVLTAFSAYFQVRWLEALDDFDACAGVNHERTEVRDEQGRRHPAELWTSCFTPRELRLLCARAGLRVEGIRSIAPGRWGGRDVSVDEPELLLIARRDGAGRGATAGC